MHSWGPLQPPRNRPDPQSRRVPAIFSSHDLGGPGPVETLSEESPLPMPIRFPSGLKLTRETSSVCPLSVSVSRPSTDLFAAAFCSASSKVRRMRGQRRRGAEVSNDYTEQERTDMM